MRKFSFILATTVLSLLSQDSAPLNAQGLCSDPRVEDRLPKLPQGCHVQLVTASGNQRPSFTWAQKSAQDHWQDQVITKFGERYSVWTNAACTKKECVPSAIAGFKRCTYSGFPCATKPEFDTSLTRPNVREMQRLLSSLGFALRVDGIFGVKTMTALQQWQRKHGLQPDGLPSLQNLEKLRDAVKA